MEWYTILKELGDGSCGHVYKARDMRTFEIVAVKRLKRKFCFWEEYTNLREIKALRKMNHQNIIKLREVVRENNELFFIFEYMDCNLYQLIKEREKPFSEEEIRCFMKQMLQGLSHMHKKGFFHRDLKPENLLVTNDVLKIADFGLAREVSSMPPYTQYVSTRWYRAPEVLLQSPCYTPAVDMWAIGAILAELFTLTPIFPGESEIDQMYKIYCILGMPDSTCFTIGANNSRLLDFVGHEVVAPVKLSDIIPNASMEAIDLITQLLSWDPSRRPDADQSLQHPFFHVNTRVPRSLSDPLELKLSNKRVKPNLELKLHDFGPDPDDCFLGLTLAVKPSVSNLDVVQNARQGMGENMLFCSDFNDHSDQSVFWTLLSPDQNGVHSSAETSLSLSFGSVQHQPIGVPQTAGFSFQPLQPNILTTPFLTLSSPYQRRHCL
ncbi:putative cyclin-dependent kinase CMGC-RCK family [Medicago truncatula]|uniref:Cyclin-dependent kinase n=1 Tax=Medicago truncatula TaxID=3880 RepID=G7LF72_MEDTR|nr:serine/threonine-protein kinase MHK isoform X1 [Medicago truncatula]XP_039684754.1 serine/threonine-protein kinase MHK isoform X1 [Medicago truncatula]AET01430.1 cyclin-dependent kinase [Medicago truncatula]RHN39005.1 putative cyclin-dependent kinase CMGC-RCK family [Medicago truncatula]